MENRKIVEAQILTKNRYFNILGYKFVIGNQNNKNLGLKYLIDIYDTNKKYYRTIGYCNTIEEGKIKALKYLANIL